MLLLDSEALSALAHGPPDRRDRVRIMAAEMRRLGHPVATSAAVLAEVVRGRGADAAVFSGLNRERVSVLDVDRAIGIRAGQLLQGAGFSSEQAVDAFLVATGDLAGGALIATVDVGDITALGQLCAMVDAAPI